MLKFAGLILFTAATTAFGILLSSAKGKRVRELAQFMLFIDEARTRIRFDRTELGRLFMQMNGKSEYDALLFLPECCEKMENMRFSDALEDAARQSRERMHLNGEDWKTVHSFFENLGTTDLEGQIANCRMHTALLERQLESARAEYAQKHKLYISLGLFSGLLVSVLLI